MKEIPRAEKTLKALRSTAGAWIAVVLLVFTVACSNSGSQATEPLQIDGVWVFQHEPEFADNALHGGVPEIVDGCLVIDDTIVVWHVDRIEEAAAAIAAAKAGESPQLLISGGGLSIDEGAEPSQIPSIITDRCPTPAVWYGAP